jgi:hypothetical protein
MQEDPHKPTEEAQLRVENELKKLNLEMEYGAKFGIAANMPLEMEGQWLDYITAFESQSKKAKTISLYTFLGQPEFLPFDMVKPDDIPTELDRLVGIMDDNNVHLDFLAEYPLETVYRFITEEFFYLPVSDMRIPGMNHGFIYEEFHPNHEYDLKKQVEDFFNSTMNLDSDFKMYFLSPVMVTQETNEAVDKEVYENRIEAFRNQYKKLTIDELKILEVDVKDVNENAKFAGVVFGLDYEGETKADNKRVKYRGTGYLNFAYVDDYWLITRIVFKGFE